MIRKFYDNWAGTRTGLLINLALFILTLFLQPGPLVWIIFAFGFAVLAVNLYGDSKGWGDER